MTVMFLPPGVLVCVTLRVQLFVDVVMFCVVPTGSGAIPSLLINVWPFCLAVAYMALMPWLRPGNVLTLAVLLRLSLTAPGISQPSLTLSHSTVLLSALS